MRPLGRLVHRCHHLSQDLQQHTMWRESGAVSFVDRLWCDHARIWLAAVLCLRYAFGIVLWELLTGRRAFQGVPVALLGHNVAHLR